jgi:uroporphyrinogen-III synthase
LILVTRPGDPGQRLAERLGALGHAALWWPAFDIVPPDDLPALAAAIARLGEYGLAVFVSPMAVRAFADAALSAMPLFTWPATVAIAAVGGATRRAASELPGARAAMILGPEGESVGDGGAEALWPILAALPELPRRVLILRAQSGRAWLADRLRTAGVIVDEQVAYRRVMHEPPAAAWAALRAGLARGDAAAGPAMAVFFSSSEAVDAVTQRLRAAGFDPAALSPGIALCAHDRIVEAARAAGWVTTVRCEAEAPAIGAALATGLDCALAAPQCDAPGRAPPK